MESRTYKVAIIGATGAIGKEIVTHALANPSISEISLLIRKKLPEWENQEKLKFLESEDFSDLTKWQQDLEGYDAFICTLGSRVGTGEDNFVKVDYTYPLNFANLAKTLSVPYYGLLTSGGAKSNSMLLYMRTKGRVEEDMAKIGLK